MTSEVGMRMFVRVGLMTTAVSCVIAGFPVSTAAQQVSESRGFVSMNGGFQATSTDFGDNIDFVLFVEEGDFDARYPVETGLSFDVSGGVRVWRSLAIGGGVSLFHHDAIASVSARFPHPFFFNQHRNVSGTAEGLTRSETAVHIQVMWVAPVNNRLDITVFGGPTFFTVKQDLVTTVEFAEEFPFDTAEFTGVSTVTATDSTVGFNIGVDVGFYFSEHVGVGGLVRFHSASIDFSSPGSDVVSADVGGLQTTGGLRVRF